MQNYQFTTPNLFQIILSAISFIIGSIFTLLIREYIITKYTYWKLEKIFKKMSKKYEGQPVGKELSDLADDFKKARKETKIYEE